MILRIYIITYSHFAEMREYKWYNWKIRCHINLGSIYILYLLTCNFCNGHIRNTGKTVNFRLRMNYHITAYRYGTPTDKFITIFLNVIIINMVPRRPVLNFACFFSFLSPHAKGL